MTTFLAFTIVGLVVGSIYALTATGLVVTYITSGIFNFAHGAIGMVAAFAYWELTVKEHWPVPLALLFVLFVLAPLMGFLIDRLLMPNLPGKPQVITLVITLGLLLFLAVLASLAGLLLAPLVTLDLLLLTLLVINGYAAAIVGRLRSLPLTFGGGLLLGLFESYAVGYVPGSLLSQLRPTLPVIFLFVAL